MRCINFIRCPNWLHPLLYNVNRLSWVRLGLSCVKLSNETVSRNKCRPISLAAFPRNNLHNKVKPWWAFFFFNMYWRYKICIAKCLYSYRACLLSWFKITTPKCTKFYFRLKTSLLKLPTMLTKKMLPVKLKRPYQRDPWINIAKLLNISIDKANRCTQGKVGFAALVEQLFDNATP